MGRLDGRERENTRRRMAGQQHNNENAEAFLYGTGRKGIDTGSQIAGISDSLYPRYLSRGRISDTRQRETDIRQTSHKFPRFSAQQSSPLKSRAAFLRFGFMNGVVA